MKRLLFLFCCCVTAIYGETYIELKETPLRGETLSDIEATHYDILIIGGGATGAGIAVDAASRGLKTLLVEKGDFGSQTSSKSTKLVHGGVRYLEKAVRNLDSKQYALVKHALEERGILLQNAPHICHPIKIVTPLYHFKEVPYMWCGLKLYDLISGKGSIGHSRFISKEEVMTTFPHLRAESLKGGLEYYDGQFNDTRLNITLITSAVQIGAQALNYVEVTNLHKKEERVKGATVLDRMSGKVYHIRATVVINATGPFADGVRQMDDKEAQTLMQPSSGTHLLIDQKFLGDAGILIPKTDDGRVLFMLPWENHTLVGTTDHRGELTDNPTPEEADLPYLLSYFNRYFNTELTEKDVLSQWTGLRPLVRDPKAKDTAALSRDHVIEVSTSGLVSIMGGKWTTYRKMAEESVDKAVAVGALPKRETSTKELRLLGAKGYDTHTVEVLHNTMGIDLDIAEHLVSSYGTNAFSLVNRGTGARIHKDHPIVMGEIQWAVEREYALTIMDVLARRTRLAFLDAQAAQESVERVGLEMKRLLGWSDTILNEQVDIAKEQIKTFSH